MEYRINKQALLDKITAWDGFLKRKVHLIACGGTALTLLGVKASTKDIDFILPEVEEYDYLIKILKQLGYKTASGWGWSREDGFIFDLFRGNSVHTTELVESPLEKENNFPVKEFDRIYLGVLNYYDIITTKLFRSTSVDIDDCLLLMRSKSSEINLNLLVNRFKQTALFDVSEDRVLQNLEHFLNVLKKEGLNDEK
jgi:hypothetical protein